MNPYITAYAVAGDAVAATMPAAITSGVTECRRILGWYCPFSRSFRTGNTVLCRVPGRCSRQGRHEHFPLHETCRSLISARWGRVQALPQLFLFQLERGFIYVRCY